MADPPPPPGFTLDEPLQKKPLAPPSGYTADPQAPAAPQKTGAQTESTSSLSALWEGLKQGGGSFVRGINQAGLQMPSLFMGGEGRRKLLGEAEQGIQQSEEAYQANPAVRAHPYIAGGGRIAGEVAPGLIAGAAGPVLRGAGLLPQVAPKVAGAVPSLAARIGGGMVGGGLGAATTPVMPPQPPRPAPGAAPAQPQPQPSGDYWGEKAKQVAVGMGLGGAIPGVGGMMAPRLPNPELVRQGISRAFRPLYNFAMGAEERTIDGFDRTIARQVLEPIGGDVPRNLKAGHGLVDHVETSIGNVYNRVLPTARLPKAAAEAPNEELATTISELAPEDAGRYHTIMQNRFWSKFPSEGDMDGQTFQRARGDLGKRAAGFLGTNNDDLGHALLETLTHLDRAVGESNPAISLELQRANTAWRMYVRMRQAAAGATNVGKFTPADLLKAVRGQERTPSGFATGDAPLQGYAEAGLEALNSRASPVELLHIFSRHGLPMEIARQLVPPVGRGMKAATPVLSPAAGRVAAERATDAYNANRRGDVPEVREAVRDLNRKRQEPPTLQAQ